MAGIPLKLHNKSNTEESSGLTKAAVWVCNRNKQGVWIAMPLYECLVRVWSFRPVQTSIPTWQEKQEWDSSLGEVIAQPPSGVSAEEDLDLFPAL